MSSVSRHLPGRCRSSVTNALRGVPHSTSCQRSSLVSAAQGSAVGNASAIVKERYSAAIAHALAANPARRGALGRHGHAPGRRGAPSRLCVCFSKRRVLTLLFVRSLRTRRSTLTRAAPSRCGTSCRASSCWPSASRRVVRCLRLDSECHANESLARLWARALTRWLLRCRCTTITRTLLRTARPGRRTALTLRRMVTRPLRRTPRPPRRRLRRLRRRPRSWRTQRSRTPRWPTCWQRRASHTARALQAANENSRAYRSVHALRRAALPAAALREPCSLGAGALGRARGCALHFARADSALRPVCFLRFPLRS